MTDFRQTIREQIIRAITSELANIRTSSGYNIDLGSTVKRGLRIEEKEKLPAVAIFPLDETNVQQPRKNQLTFNVRVEAAAKFGTKNPSIVAEAMLGDIIRCITSDPGSITKLTDGIQYEEGGVEDYPESQEYSIGVYTVFKVTYKTVKGDPFIHKENLTIEQSESFSISEDVNT